MAKLSAHGIELGRIEFSTYTKAYFADGKVLKNSGFGWKLHSKFKAGIDPVEGFARAKAKRQAFVDARPHYAAYVRELDTQSDEDRALWSDSWDYAKTHGLGQDADVEAAAIKADAQK